MAKPSITSLYADLEGWARVHSARLVSALRPPAAVEELAALEAILERPLPGELREALALHDGRATLDSYTLLSAARIRQRYLGELENVDRLTTPGNRTCKPVKWSRGWIPFAEDGGLNFLCIDLDPGPRGKAGQVIRWERSSMGADAAPWDSFGAWLAAFVDACHAGAVDVDDEGFVTVT